MLASKLQAPSPNPMTKKRVRLCMQDLYHRDVVEMVERETRRYEIFLIEDPDDPDFPAAYELLWNAFGPQGEMEREEAVRTMLRAHNYEVWPDGGFKRYFLLVAKDRQGIVRGARDGGVLFNARYAPDLCVVYLSHIYMTPEARGTVLSYWLRIAPVEVALQYLADLHALGRLVLPAPENPGRYFGMHIDLCAEMEFFTPEDTLSLQRLLFYGRGGFSAINPRHFPYRQPDFRDPAVIRQTGNQPVPFMLLVRRLGRERFATMPIEEARAIMEVLYDDFATHCDEEFLDRSLQIVLDRLEERAKRKSYVELLPLPTASHDLSRLRRLFRHKVYTTCYPGAPGTERYLQGRIAEALTKNPHYLDDELTRLAGELESRTTGYVYANRNKEFTWEGLDASAGVDLPADFSGTGEWPVPAGSLGGGPPPSEDDD